MGYLVVPPTSELSTFFEEALKVVKGKRKREVIDRIYNQYQSLLTYSKEITKKYNDISQEKKEC